jgi:hypothetical protein
MRCYHIFPLYYQRTRVPREPAGRRRRTFWMYHTHLSLRHVGDVTLVLSKKGRNLSPKQTKILVTNLAELTPSQVVCIYQKCWAVELMHWELKSGLGLGEHQVSEDKDRSEKSLGIAVLAYLFVLRVSPRDRPQQTLEYLSASTYVAARVMTNQVEHKAKVKMAKTRKAT